MDGWSRAAGTGGELRAEIDGSGRGRGLLGERVQARLGRRTGR